MTDDVKRKTLAFLLVAVILTVLFATALPQLELKPGIPMPGNQNHTGDASEGGSTRVFITIDTYLKSVLIISIVLSLAYVIYKLIKHVSWKEVIGPAISIAVITLIILSITFALNDVSITTEQASIETLPPEVVVKGPPLGSIPPFLIWLVVIMLGITILLFVSWVIRRRGEENRYADPLMLDAEWAIKALRTGKDFKNVIVQCYRQMSQTLQKEQGIKLEETMTAREFERLLESRGIPHDPVHQLTQLFEIARYGNQQPKPADEQTAINCLNAVIQYTKAKGQPD